jgi:hypothetical protein
MMKSAKQSVEWELSGETEVLGETLPQCVRHKSHMPWTRPAMEHKAALFSRISVFIRRQESSCAPFLVVSIRLFVHLSVKRVYKSLMLCYIRWWLVYRSAIIMKFLDSIFTGRMETNSPREKLVEHGGIFFWKIFCWRCHVASNTILFFRRRSSYFLYQACTWFHPVNNYKADVLCL